MRTDQNGLLKPEEAAAFLGLQPCMLAAWREDGSTPSLAFFKIGKAVRLGSGFSARGQTATASRRYCDVGQAVAIRCLIMSASGSAWAPPVVGQAPSPPWTTKADFGLRTSQAK
jgi:hypothetical protein